MDILIAGGTGFVGRHLANALVNRGHRVVAMSRNPSASVVPAEVELRTGDVTEYDGLPSTLEDMDVVVHLVALSPLYRPKGGKQMHERVHVQGTRNLVRAMEAAEVDRLIHVSGLGADPQAPTAFLQAKGRAEGIVTSANLDATIFRPAVVFGDGAEFVPFIKRVTTPYVTGLPGGGKTQFQPLWVGDLVDGMAEAIENPDEHIGNAYDVAGRDVFSLAEATKAVYEADGRWVRIIPIPMPLTGLAMTVAGPLPLIPFGRDQYRALKLDNIVDENDMTIFASRADLLGFETYLRRGAPQPAPSA